MGKTYRRCASPWGGGTRRESYPFSYAGVAKISAPIRGEREGGERPRPGCSWPPHPGLLAAGEGVRGFCDTLHAAKGFTGPVETVKMPSHWRAASCPRPSRRCACCESVVASPLECVMSGLGLCVEINAFQLLKDKARVGLLLTGIVVAVGVRSAELAFEVMPDR